MFATFELGGKQMNINSYSYHFFRADESRICGASIAITFFPVNPLKKEIINWFNNPDQGKGGELTVWKDEDRSKILEFIKFEDAFPLDYSEDYSIQSNNSTLEGTLTFASEKVNFSVNSVQLEPTPQSKNVDFHKGLATHPSVDFANKLIKNRLNQQLFNATSKDIRQYIYEDILRLLKDLEDNKILKRSKITYFDINKDQPDRFDIKLSVTPMFVTSAFDYTISVAANSVNEGEDNA